MGADVPVEGKTVRTMAFNMLKRTHYLFSNGVINSEDEDAILRESQARKLACKVRDEYQHLAESPYGQGMDGAVQAGKDGKPHSVSAASGTSKALTITHDKTKASESQAAQRAREVLARSRATVKKSDGTVEVYKPSVAVMKRLASRWPRPKWHAPWKTYRVISGHLGWASSIAFEPGNEWFATGSGDRTVKIWDTASGTLKLTLTGHTEQVTGLAVSDQFPYMFSCGLDKKVMCWDLEQNKVIRNYHGHLSGVYSIALHPALPLLITGGRDSAVRVWDIRTRHQVHCMSGHQSTVASLLTHAADPQVISGSHDKQIRLWDIRTGNTLHTLTYHKKSVRALAMSDQTYAFIGAGGGTIKKYNLPDGEFCHNMIQTQPGIINCMAINPDGVVASGADDGSLWFWDWHSGNCFQKGQTIPQPGSLESEAGILDMAFDRSGTRLITCEADKSIKMWRQDNTATEESHPVDFRPPKDIVRRY